MIILKHTEAAAAENAFKFFFCLNSRYYFRWEDAYPRGGIVNIGEYAEEEVPYPLEDMKKIFGKYHANNEYHCFARNGLN